MTRETRALIQWWKIRAERESDPFVRFFIFYMCLDAWITSDSGFDSDTKKLNWLKSTNNQLKAHWPKTPHKKVSLNGLKKIGRIEDMRPNHRDNYLTLTDIDDFSQVIDFIYLIRCNLFHGGKSPVNSNDKLLVTHSSKILSNWIQWTLIKTGPRSL